MTNAPTNAAPAEVTAIDTTARGPLLLLLGSAVVWLVVSGTLALIASIQLHSPHFLADCAWFTHGRMAALRETAFVYGWLANAGMAIALWVLARLGGSPLRALNWVIVGALFWNAGVTLGLVGISAGDMTSFSLFQLPRYVQPVLLFAYGAMAVAGVLAWTDRRTDGTYVSQWYAVAALFLFPWLFSAAQIMLLWSPVRGALQAVAAAWYAQGALSVWLAPIALAAAYYIVPKVTGRTLGHYKLFAVLGFWTLIFTGPWTAGRLLVGGPVPAWIASIAVGAYALLAFHYIVIVLNLRPAFGAGGTALKFITFGLGAYVLSGIVDTLTAFRGVAVRTQFTLFSAAQQELALYGAITMIFFGAIYYMLPRLTGRAWASPILTVGHRLVVQGGLVILLIALAVGGWAQGADLLDAKLGLADVYGRLHLSLLAASAAQLVLLFGNLLLLVNFCQSACVWGTDTPTETPFRQPATMEANAS